MNDEQAARELVLATKDLMAGSFLKRAIRDFIDDNREAIEADEYAFARVKLMGPEQDSKWMNVSLEELEKLSKVASSRGRTSAIQFKEVDTEFGRSAVALIGLEKAVRGARIEDRQAARSIYNHVQDAIESHEAAMDEWDDWKEGHEL